MILCKTPLRVSLFGGGTDFPTWFNKHNGMTISMAIDKYCYILIRELPKTFPFKYRLRYFRDEHVKKIKDIKHPSIRETIKYKKQPSVSFEDGRNALILANAAYDSYNSGKVIDIKYD